MHVTVKSFLTFLALASVLGFAACKQEGVAEKAGQKVDQVIGQTGKKIDQATEQTGRKMKQAGEAPSEKNNKTGEYIDNAILAAKVKAEIASDPVLKEARITVTTNKGVVRLSGVVDSEQSIDKLLEITSRIGEVQTVVNNLDVKSAY